MTDDTTGFELRIQLGNAGIPGLISFAPTRPRGRWFLVRSYDGKAVFSVRD